MRKRKDTPISPAPSDNEDDAPEAISFAVSSAASAAQPAVVSTKKRSRAVVRPLLKIAPIAAEVLAALDIPPVAARGLAGSAKGSGDVVKTAEDEAEEERARRRRARARARARAAEEDAAARARPPAPIVRDGIHVVVAPAHGRRFHEQAHDDAAADAAAAALATAAGFVKAHLFGSRVRRVGATRAGGTTTAVAGRRTAAPRGLHVAAFATSSRITK